MFDWLKPKSSTVKKVLTMRHKTGETITVTVEGTNLSHVNYMKARIEKLFSFSERVDAFPDKEFEKVFEDMNKVFEDAEKVMKKTFGKE